MIQILYVSICQNIPQNYGRKVSICIYIYTYIYIYILAGHAGFLCFYHQHSSTVSPMRLQVGELEANWLDAVSSLKWFFKCGGGSCLFLAVHTISALLFGVYTRIRPHIPSLRNHGSTVYVGSCRVHIINSSEPHTGSLSRAVLSRTGLEAQFGN